jgi:hypothetical protein
LANQGIVKKPAIISNKSGAAQNPKKDSLTATFSLTAGNSFFPSTLPVIGNKPDEEKPILSDIGSQHFSVPRSLKYDDVRSMTSNQSISYKIMIEAPG